MQKRTKKKKAGRAKELCTGGGVEEGKNYSSWDVESPVP